MIDLKPCPMCGKEAALGTTKIQRQADHSGRYKEFTGHHVNCIWCGVSNRGIAEGFETPEKAAEHWNKRTVTEALPQWRDPKDKPAHLPGEHHSEDVLLCMTPRSAIFGGDHGIRIGHVSCGHWRPVGGNGNFDDDVLGWMPLPEAPRSPLAPIQEQRNGWEKANHREESLERSIHALPGTRWDFWIRHDDDTYVHRHVLPPFIPPSKCLNGCPPYTVCDDCPVKRHEPQHCSLPTKEK